MDRLISASEANQRFSELLRDVVAGESFTVTSRGRPVARVLPITDQPSPGPIQELLKRLAREPVRISGPWTREDLYD